MAVVDGRCDPTAKRLFRLLEEWPDEELLLVYAQIVASGIELVPGGAGEPLERSAAWLRCKRSLAAAADDLGKCPSWRGYGKWRAAQPHPDEWASGSSVLRILGAGRWQVAVEALGGPWRDISARRLLANGGAFSREECVVAVCLFCDEVPARSRSAAAYRSWARAYSRKARAPRVPVATEVLVRQLGGPWSRLRADMTRGVFDD